MGLEEADSQEERLLLAPEMLVHVDLEAHLPVYSTGCPSTLWTWLATHFRVRQDKVDKTGRVTLRYQSRLHHIGLGRAHKGRAVKLLIANQSVRVSDLTGQLIRELTLDPSRDYQPLSAA